MRRLALLGQLLQLLVKPHLNLEPFLDEIHLLLAILGREVLLLARRLARLVVVVAAQGETGALLTRSVEVDMRRLSGLLLRVSIVAHVC